jgi:hypothetical protein
VRVRQPAAEYVGFRVLKESKINAAAK